MIVQRPGTWATMSGKLMMDDDSCRGAIAMSGFQQVEATRPGGSSSSSGWGTCAELLLVSAVKKHGVPNWNLVALELKARAILLDLPPSCFSDEACRFKYDVLKGQFASGSGFSSPDDDRNGVSWFEELRKVRMSHLKEELQVYDSSIGKLQSRISKLKEERARGLSLQSVMKQYDNSCEVDTNSTACKSDFNAHIRPRRCEETPDEPQDLGVEDFMQPDQPAGNLAAGGTRETLSDGEACETVHEGLDVQKDGPLTSMTNLTSQDAIDEGEKLADFTEAKGPSPDSKGPSEMVPENGEEQLANDGETAALQPGEYECGKQEPVREEWAAASDQATTVVPSETSGGTGVEDSVAPRGDDGFVDSENQDIAGAHNGAQSKRLDSDGPGSTVFSPLGARSTNTEMDEPPESLVVTCEVPDGAPEAEASAGRRIEGDSSCSRDSRLSRLSLSYVRAEKEKRLKAEEDAKRKRMTQHEEVVEVVEDGPSPRPVDASELPSLERTDVNGPSVLLEEQNEGGRTSSRDPAPFDVDAGSTAIDIGSEVSSGGGTDTKGNETSPIDADAMDVLPESPGLISIKGTEAPRSLGVDLSPLAGFLTVALGPDPDHLDPRPSSDGVPLKLESSPSTHSEEDISHASSLKREAVPRTETLNEVESAGRLIDMVAADVEREEVAQAPGDDVRAESDISKVGQDEEERVVEQQKVVEEVDMVGAQEEVETLDTDLGTSVSAGDDVSETLDLKGSENAQEESRDGHEIGEGQQPFPDYADTQIDKSDVGSSMDSIEDMSPSSRKNRREPKVPGKLLPLLECLRVICAHKFAPLFRQRQEYQDNAEYDRLVRRHVDLSMIRSRLEDGAYSGSVEFFRDLLLIFTNALVYNSSDSQEYAGAKVLRTCALSEMHKILQTEALLKQNGPATRKREVRKSMEVHKSRVSSTSGSEGRKKGNSKGSNGTAAALDLHVGARSAHAGLEDAPNNAGRTPNNSSDGGRDLEGRVEGRVEAFKKLPPSRVVKEETSRKELQKSEFLSGEGSKSGTGGGSSGKKGKGDSAAQKTSSQVLADLRSSGGRLNVENIGTKSTPAKMKDVMCIDVERKGPLNISSSVATGKQRTTPNLRQPSTSRVSRYSKRAGESTTSNPKKRVRK